MKAWLTAKVTTYVGKGGEGPKHRSLVHTEKY